ncbi:MAG: hypothetical protein GY811_07245 [Myxococcales bacterium]|nr:hypothetical protein [Myxococcales bacterium]
MANEIYDEEDEATSAAGRRTFNTALDSNGVLRTEDPDNEGVERVRQLRFP